MKVRARKGLCLAKPILEEGVSKETGIVWQMSNKGSQIVKCEVVDADPMYEVKRGDVILVDKLATRVFSYTQEDGTEVFALNKNHVLAVLEEKEASIENGIRSYSQESESLCQIDINSSKS
jgi:co-chaperonin GroES (HSP10)